MKINNDITGKQVLSDCVTLVKHLSVYVACVTLRVVDKVKCMIAEKDKPQSATAKTVTATSGEASA